MGRLIDIDDFHKRYMFHAECKAEDEFHQIIKEIKKYEAIPKDQYEARLKADMVAMLTEIQLEIEECVDGAEGSPQFEQGVDIARCQVVDIVQQKINALRGREDEIN